MCPEMKQVLLEFTNLHFNQLIYDIVTSSDSFDFAINEKTLKKIEGYIGF